MLQARDLLKGKKKKGEERYSATEICTESIMGRAGYLKKKVTVPFLAVAQAQVDYICISDFIKKNISTSQL